MQKEAGIEAQLDSHGKIGELTVWVGDKQLIKKGLFRFPEKAAVLEAVRRDLAGGPSAT